MSCSERIHVVDTGFDFREMLTGISVWGHATGSSAACTAPSSTDSIAGTPLVGRYEQKVRVACSQASPPSRGKYARFSVPIQLAQWAIRICMVVNRWPRHSNPDKLSTFHHLQLPPGENIPPVRYTGLHQNTTITMAKVRPVATIDRPVNRAHRRSFRISTAESHGHR